MHSTCLHHRVAPLCSCGVNCQERCEDPLHYNPELEQGCIQPCYKEGLCYEGAKVEWIDGNLGSKLTMKYPGVYMLGKNAHAEVISVAFAGKDQHQDAGAKAVHLAPNTTSRITSKSVSKDSGRTTYRGL